MDLERAVKGFGRERVGFLGDLSEGDTPLIVSLARTMSGTWKAPEGEKDVTCEAKRQDLREELAPVLLEEEDAAK